MKYFFFDIDGTLTDRKTNKIVPSAQLALDKLQANGHFVAIATGRAHYKAKAFMDEVHIKHMVCNGGGALVYNEHLVINTPLDHHLALQLYYEAKANHFGVLVMLDDSINVYSEDDLFVKQTGGRKEPTNYIVDPNFDLSKHQNIYKLYIAVSKEEQYKLPTLDKMGYLRFEQPYLNIQYDDKISGIYKMIELVDGNLDDVVVFGDDHNDLIMFDKRFTKIAMGNACDALKKEADYVTANNIDDGIYLALKHFNWIS